MVEQGLKSRFPGALTGTGTGDSPGAPFEGRHDDTPIMTGVAESLVRVGGSDGEDMVQTFVTDYEQGRPLSCNWLLAKTRT